jgi:hypothetical protein
MRRKRCIAFRQSEDYPELLMPCEALAEGRLLGQPKYSKSDGGFFCREHARSYRELMAGILNETRACKSRRDACKPSELPEALA